MSFIHILLLAVVIFWGWSFVATKVCLNYWTPVEILGLRYLLAIPVLIAIAAYKNIRPNFSRRDWIAMITGSAILTAHFLIQINGMRFTSATNTGWIIAFTPLTIALLSFIFLRERIGLWQIAGIVVATTGIAILVSDGNLGQLDWLESKGDWMIFASTGTWAAYSVVTRDVGRHNHPIAVTIAMLLLTALVVVPYMMIDSTVEHLISVPMDGVISMLFLGIICLALAMWIWQEGLARLGASKTGFFLYIEPLATVALAVPYLGEPFGAFTALGGALVLGGVYLAERGKENSKVA
jgi:drug/metabolite transporter (DMT)-like permease